jgi:hypothetical protein
MTAQSVKYFEQFLDAGRSIAVHRLDELVQVTFSHGRHDERPDVVFFAPTSAHAFVEAVDAAARDAQAVFDAGQLAHRAPARAEAPPAGGLPPWGPAFDYGGLPVADCPAGDGRVSSGQAAKVETATGRVWHDDCAETAGAYRQSLTCPDSPAPASAPPEELSAAATSGGADRAAGADRASAVPCRPAAPTTTRRS